MVTMLGLVRRRVWIEMLRNERVVRFVLRGCRDSENRISKIMLEEMIKRTAFRHYAAGETLREAQETLASYATRNIGSILDSSAEEGEDAENWHQNLCDKIELLEFVSRHAKLQVKFIPIKITSLMSRNELENANVEAASMERLRLLCNKARECGISLLFDAETSDVQPQVHGIVQRLSVEHNKHKPVAYNTYQMYLKTTQPVLEDHLRHANGHDYFLGIKLVRGAYLFSPLESGNRSRFHASKLDTDMAYNEALRMLAHHRGKLSIVVATHNPESIEIARRELWPDPSLASHVHFAQLKGMGDSLTEQLASEGYQVSKLVPYARFQSLLPWLLRRLEENYDPNGAAQQYERTQLNNQIRKHFEKWSRII